MKKLLATTLIVAMGASVSMASINVVGDKADASIGLDAVGGNKTIKHPNQSVLTAADDNYNDDQGDNVAIMVFELPDLGGEAVSSANLSFDLQCQWPTADSYPAGLDLYGVRYGAAPAAVVTTDYDLATSSLIQDDVATLANNNDATYASYTTVTASGAGLATWLTAQYTAGAVAGNFVYLRFESDVHTASPWNIVSADGTSGTPVLTITTTPISSGIDLRAYQAAEGTYVEFVAYDVEEDGTIRLALLGEDGETVWTGEADVQFGPRFVARLLVPGLVAGKSYDFAVTDEVGLGWAAPGVVVGTFETKMASLSRTSLALSFDSLPQREYEIQWTPAIGSPWQAEKTVVAEGNHTRVVVDYPNPEDPTGFFRVQLK